MTVQDTAVGEEDGNTFEVGLGPLLEDLAARVGGILDGPRARRVRSLIGDRYTIAVTSEEIRTRGIVRTHHARWSQIETILLEPVTAMAARRVVGHAAGRLVRRYVPIPGLRWLAQQVVSVVVDPVADLAGRAGEDLPAVFVAAREHDGDGVELDGMLALTSLLSGDLTREVERHALARGIPVRRVSR